MGAALHSGTPPAWTTVLIAAETWGVPPWEIAGDGDRVTWFYRWIELQNARGMADKYARRAR